MRANRKRDTSPEVGLRRQLHRLGLRYVLGKKLPTTPPALPDLIFPRAKVAVFVDGCFWHGCSVHGVRPRTNALYWAKKIRTNKERDQRVDRALNTLGWLPVRVWEHDDLGKAAAQIAELIRRLQRRRF